MAALLLLSDESLAQVFHLNRAMIIIGKRPDCDIVLSDARVSKMHARIVQKADGLYIEDMKSTNTTRVGGIALKTPRR
jgi:pSer/pThr/pTyr-binding forkhead associated (FHA) protein